MNVEKSSSRNLGNRNYPLQLNDTRRVEIEIMTTAKPGETTHEGHAGRKGNDGSLGQHHESANGEGKKSCDSTRTPTPPSDAPTSFISNDLREQDKKVENHNAPFTEEEKSSIQSFSAADSTLSLSFGQQQHQQGGSIIPSSSQHDPFSTNNTTTTGSSSMAMAMAQASNTGSNTGSKTGLFPLSNAHQQISALLRNLPSPMAPSPLAPSSLGTATVPSSLLNYLQAGGPPSSSSSSSSLLQQPTMASAIETLMLLQQQPQRPSSAPLFASFTGLQQGQISQAAMPRPQVQVQPHPLATNSSPSLQQLQLAQLLLKTKSTGSSSLPNLSQHRAAPVPGSSFQQQPTALLQQQLTMAQLMNQHYGLSRPGQMMSSSTARPAAQQQQVPGITNLINVLLTPQASPSSLQHHHNVNVVPPMNSTAPTQVLDSQQQLLLQRLVQQQLINDQRQKQQRLANDLVSMLSSSSQQQSQSQAAASSRNSTTIAPLLHQIQPLPLLSAASRMEMLLRSISNSAGSSPSGSANQAAALPSSALLPGYGSLPMVPPQSSSSSSSFSSSHPRDHQLLATEVAETNQSSPELAPSSWRPSGAPPKKQSKQDRWMMRFEELKIFQKKHGHCRVPHGYRDNRRLSWWVMNQRAQYHLMKKGNKSWLSGDRVDMLDDMGFDWKPVVATKSGKKGG